MRFNKTKDVASGLITIALLALLSGCIEDCPAEDENTGTGAISVAFESPADVVEIGVTLTNTTTGELVQTDTIGPHDTILYTDLPANDGYLIYAVAKDALGVTLYDGVGAIDSLPPDQVTAVTIMQDQSADGGIAVD